MQPLLICAVLFSLSAAQNVELVIDPERVFIHPGGIPGVFSKKASVVQIPLDQVLKF